MSVEKYEFEDLTPSGSTGSMNTIENGLRALVDWVSVTIKDVQSLSDACGILGLKESEFEVREVGFRGYLKSATYGKIMVAWEPPKNTIDMGVHIELSGEACREYEQHFDLEFNWSQFFALIMNFNHKFSRLDIAIDDFKGYFTINQVYRTAKRGCMTAKRIKKARTYEEFFIDDGKTFGRTFYVGKSDWMFRFYDKLPERLNKGIDLTDSLKCWNRYEIQLRNNIATEAAHVLAYEAYSLGAFAKGFFKAKIDFKINNVNDSNKSRWKSQKWWLKFLDDCEEVELTQIAPDPSIPRIANWFDVQVDTSFATFLEAFDNDPVVVDFYKLKGAEKMERKHERMIQEFNKNPELKRLMYEDMKNFVKEKTRYQTTTVL